MNLHNFHDYIIRGRRAKACSRNLNSSSLRIYNNLVLTIGWYTRVRDQKMKLYWIPDGPPSIACRLGLVALNLDFELSQVDFPGGEHMTADFVKLNPQKEIPVLIDGDLTIGESNAILQYLGDKYDTDGKLYPKDPAARAIVNHRLCFCLSTYYRYILDYAIEPIFFAYERTPLGLKKMHIGLNAFNTYLSQGNTTYVAGDNLTIADFQFVAATLCLEATDFSLTEWPLIGKWYENFKTKHPDLWKLAEEGMQLLSHFAKNPPDLSHMDHPIHPIRK